MEGVQYVVSFAIVRLAVPVILFLTIGTLLERRGTPHWR
jgi:hypothetical protein